MKKFIILIPTLFAMVMVLVCCTSETQTTTTTTRQTTMTTGTTADHSLPSQPAGYRDNNMEMGPGMGGR